MENDMQNDAKKAKVARKARAAKRSYTASQSHSSDRQQESEPAALLPISRYSVSGSVRKQGEYSVIFKLRSAPRTKAFFVGSLSLSF
jgi:hypothetical protein